jgi:hypothetical protein
MVHYLTIALKSELLVMFFDPDMAEDSVCDLHQYMDALQLSSVFPQIFKLCELVLIPGRVLLMKAHFQL